MPLGISESTIKAAYGPVDYSSLYRSISEFSKRAYEQERLEKRALQKEYYTSLAVLDKDKKGMNPNDTNEFMGHYNKYKSAQEKIISNPGLIDNNPKEYGRLKAESDDAYSNASSLIGQSKQTQLEVSKLWQHALTNSNDLADGALDEIKGLSQKTSKEIIENNLLDLGRYKYQGPKLDKFYKDITDIDTSDKYRKPARVVTYSDDKDAKAVVYDSYSIVDPLEVQNGINNLLSTEKNRLKASTYLLNQFGSQVDEAKKMYNSLTDADFAKYKTATGEDMFKMHYPFDDISKPMTRKPDLLFDDNNPEVKLNAFLVARPIINSIKSPKQIGTRNNIEFTKGALGKDEYAQKLAIQLKTAMAKIRQKYPAAIRSNKLTQEEKDANAKFKVLLGIAGSKIKSDIGLGLDPDKSLDDVDFDKLESAIDKIIVKKKAYNKK